MITAASRALTRFLLWLIAGYQFLLSPLLGPCCRFAPSCSEYAVMSLQRYGLFKGVALTVWRLLRCQPLCKGGYDPPERLGGTS